VPIVITSQPLERLILRENVRELFAAMTPSELVLALLRADFYTDDEIAEILGLSVGSVGAILSRAQERIEATLPREVAGLVQGRRRSSCPEADPLQPEADLAPSQVASLLEVTPQHVQRWCREGHFPHAYRDEGGCGRWLIPARDLDRFVPSWLDRRR
jgi:DNA-binding CsgD family transcriptional regulator